VVAISVFAILGVLGKFGYIFFLKDRDIEIDLFDYKFLSHFLWAFGTQLFAVSMGALLWLSASFHPRKSRSKKIFRRLSFLATSIGFYFMCWIFMDTEVFDEDVEVIGSIIFSLVTTSAFLILMKFLSRELNSIKELKDSFFDYIIEFRLHYKKLLINALHRNEQYKDTLDVLNEDLHSDAYDEMLKKDTEATEQVMKEKAKEIDEWDV
jgi:hypothetical protein